MIDSYSFGAVQIDGKTYNHDVICYRGQITPWWRQEGHHVEVADIQLLLAEPPQVVVFGTGAMGVMKVTEKAKAVLQRAGIEVCAEPSDRAIQRFNELTKQGRDVALAIHLTC